MEDTTVEGPGDAAPPPRLVGIASSQLALPASPGDALGDGALGDGAFGAGILWIDRESGTVSSVERRGTRSGDSTLATPRSELIDLGDRLVVPGFVDVHVHGGGGSQVNAGSATEAEAAVAEIAAFHARHGTTALLATTVSDTPERLAATVEGIARAARATRGTDDMHAARGARVLGCHLEGPFISPGRAGAQDPLAIRPPDREELRRLLELGEGTVRLVTLAPELPGAMALFDDCLEAGAAVALGHSDATFDVARAAFDAGATHVTHLFNAMAPFHQRSPGLIGAALQDERVTVELICDLHHVHPAVIATVARVAASRLVLVTDATGAAGSAPGRLVLGRVPVLVDGTRVSLEADSSTLAGSALVMAQALANVVNAAGLPLPVALECATAIPARLAWGTARRAGRLVPGAPADFVVLESTLAVAATVVGGSVVFDPNRLLR